MSQAVVLKILDLCDNFSGLRPVESKPFFGQKSSHKWERKTLPQGVAEILYL